MKQQSTDTLTSDSNTLLKIIKRTFHSFDAILSLMGTEADPPLCLSKTSEETKYLLAILKKHKQTPNDHLHLADRLRSKIRDYLSLARSKWQTSPHFKYLKGFYQQMELALKLYQSNNNLSQFISKTYCLIHQQLRMFKIRTSLPEPLESLGPTNQLNRVYSLTQKQQSKGRPLEGKISNVASLYKLDIDNFYLKVTFLTGQKRIVEHINSQLERNKVSSERIQRFEKCYYLHKLKGKTRTRSILAPKTDNQSTRIKTSVHQKLYRNVREERTRRTESKENQDDSKTTYKVNSLYVSGNEFDMYCRSSKKRWIGQQKNKKKSTMMLCEALTSKSCSREERVLINFIA